ncbi:hypothetical protein [Aestuariivirga sp.]|uniref:hypothetical protein n=1 Tax=Aestuariivirga sp. TaxID=2650926 RepID=UPI0039E55AC3
MGTTQQLSFLHADACSFAAAMAKTEVNSVERLRAGQALFEEAAQAFGGRVLDKVGDSILLAFPRADAAYLAAETVARKTSEAQASDLHPIPFLYRMGITSGRAQTRGDTLYGHCINVAARISSLVAKGNIGIGAMAWPFVQKFAAQRPQRHRRLFAKPEEPFVDFVEIGADGNSVEKAAARDHNEPFVAICFPSDLSQAGANGILAGFILEALEWEFASFFSSQGWNTATFHQNGKGGSGPPISADYVVRCGSVRTGSGVRVFVSLSSPYLSSGAQTFSRDAAETTSGHEQVMALVSLVGSAIAGCEHDRAAHMKSAGLHQLITAARMEIGAFTPERMKLALKYLHAARDLDPEHPLLHSSLARAHTIAWRFGWWDQKTDHLSQALDLARRAYHQKPDHPLCEADLAFAKFWANETEEAVWHYERVVEALPYHPELAADAGMVFGYARRFSQAATVLQRSIANVPNDADYRLWSLGDVYHSMKDYKQALSWVSRMRDQSQAQRLMAACKVRLGLDPSPHVAKILEMQPDFSVERWVSIQPMTDEFERIDFEEALFEAGLPR